MTSPTRDERCSDRRARDEQIAAEPQLPPRNAPAAPFEKHLNAKHRHAIAIVGVVENGLVRPVDSDVKLAERSRLIIVASEER